MDTIYMRRALTLAAKGRTSPNPYVGCVIVKGKNIVGEGYHHKAGMPHAEIEALRHAGQHAKNATMYVTLEPCCHTNKRTPPCTEAIITSGITKVVVACKDPNPSVNGKGIAALRRAGIAVSVGLLKKEALKLNEWYLSWITIRKPFVILKLATSLDGKIATRTGESQWITNELSRNYVHELRDRVDAVLVGSNTVLKDNPRLTCRIKNGHDPLRVVVDSTLKIPLDAAVLKDKNALIATTHRADSQKFAALHTRGIEVISFSAEQVPLEALLSELGKRGIASVMIEGGSSVAWSAVHSGIVDKVVWFIAPKIIGGITAPSAVGGEGFSSLRDVLSLHDVEIKRFGDDVCIEGYATK